MRKKFNVLFLTVTLGLSLISASTGFAAENVATQSNASESTQDEALYVATESIPNNVSEYAQDAFSNFNKNDLNVIGLDSDPSDLSLSTGFKVNLITEQSYDKYYFPVLNQDTAVALLVVDDIGGTLSYTLIQDDVSSFINTTKTSKSKPFNICVSDTTVYAVNSDQNIKVEEEYPDTGEENQQLDTSIFNYSPLSEANKTITTLPIDGDHVFDVKMGEANTFAPSNVTYTAVGKSCNTLPCVNNKTVNGKGTCWASSTAAIAEYIKYGQNKNALKRAKSIRDELLKIHSSSGMGMYDTEKFIKEYTGRELSVVHRSLSWKDARQQILNYDNPVYMYLEDNDDDYRHACVLCGYDYNSSTGNNKRMYIMDPNKSKWVIRSFGSTYVTDSGIVYNWTYSLIK